MRVVDASVALKWFLAQEKGHERALVLIEEHASQQKPIIVPDLLFYEVTNVLAVVTKIPHSEIEQILEWLYQLDLQIATLGRDDFKHTALLAQEHQISVYDASYVVLAVSLGADFVTADQKLKQQLKAHRVKIELIES